MNGVLISLKKIFLIATIFFSLIPMAIANNVNNFVFNKGNLLMVAPPVINKDSYLVEFGFITEKLFQPWNYNYNAYANAVVFEDWTGRTDKYRAGGLGFKGGVMVPTQPWAPVLFTLTAGFAKTVLNKNPLVGREGANADKKDMFLLEAGLLYHYDKYLIRFAYQKSTVKYFTRHTLLMFGVSY